MSLKEAGTELRKSTPSRHGVVGCAVGALVLPGILAGCGDDGVADTTDRSLECVDVSDDLAPSIAKLGPVEGYADADIRRVALRVEGDDIVVTWEVGGEVPRLPSDDARSRSADYWVFIVGENGEHFDLAVRVFEGEWRLAMADRRTFEHRDLSHEPNIDGVTISAKFPRLDNVDIGTWTAHVNADPIADPSRNNRNPSTSVVDWCPDEADVSSEQ